jgi:hypothetical protein
MYILTEPRRAGANVGGRAEEQSHRGLGDHRGEAAREVEDNVPQRPEGVLDVLAEDHEKQHVAEDVVPAAMQEHSGDPAHAPRLRPMAGAVNGARIERGLEDRRVEVRELIEEPHREIGDDQRDVDDREALGELWGSRTRPPVLTSAFMRLVDHVV